MKKLLIAASACLVLVMSSVPALAHGGHHGARYAAQNVCVSGYSQCPYISAGEVCPGHADGHGCAYENCLYLNAEDCAAHHSGVCGYGCESYRACSHRVWRGGCHRR